MYNASSEFQGKQKLAVLGATGSIGDSTLALVRLYPERFSVYALSGFTQWQKLFRLCQEFLPVKVCTCKENADKLRQSFVDANLNIQIVTEEEGLVQIASDQQVDTVVAAIVGSAGLLSTIAAVKSGKQVLLANKESLVMAGELLMRLAKENCATILPIDSEHNAIFQCLPKEVQKNNQNIHESHYGVKRLWLTASGGGFLNKTLEQMATASVDEAINHPNWSMGKKISIDSATMMNKGLELIEAHHLFNLPVDRISVVIHPNSVVHSLVEYADGSFLAQLGSPDMKTPIAHALAYPHRMCADVRSLDLYQLADLKFIEPDLQKFACLDLAYQAAKMGAGACIALNAANEVAVQAFLDEKIKLTDIAVLVEKCLFDTQVVQFYQTDFSQTDEALQNIIQMDRLARQVAEQHKIQIMENL